MIKETPSTITTVTFSNFYEKVKTETYNKKKKSIHTKHEQLLNRAISGTGLKNQLELQGYKQVKEI